MNITRCKACSTEIVFLPTRRGKVNPVDLSSIPTPEGEIPREYIRRLRSIDIMFDYNTHVSHFLTCPESSRFKRTKRAETTEPPRPQAGAVQETLL